MHRSLRRSVTLLTLGMSVLLTGCATQVLVDYEEGTNFRAFRTFRIVSPDRRMHQRDVTLSPIVDRRIERALASSLQTRGLRPDELGPDLLVYFHTITRTRTRVNSWSTGGSWWGRYGYYGFHGGRHYVDVDQYEEGTFIIDLVDARDRRLVWRGASPERLGWDAPTQAEIDAIVGRILENYPPDGVIGPGLGLTQEPIPSV